MASVRPSISASMITASDTVRAAACRLEAFHDRYVLAATCTPCSRRTVQIDSTAKPSALMVSSVPRPGDHRGQPHRQDHREPVTHTTAATRIGHSLQQLQQLQQALGQAGPCCSTDTDATGEDDMTGAVLRGRCWCENFHPHRPRRARTSPTPARHTTNPQVTDLHVDFAKALSRCR